MKRKSVGAYRLSRFENNLLTRTEKAFLASGYQFERWPEIYYGNFEDFQNTKKDKKNHDFLEKDYNIYDPDYLGLYVYEVGSEGHIRIFKDRIQNCAERISTKLNLNISEVADVLKAIVLIHEFGHWKTHWCHSINSSHRRHEFLYLPKVIKETLAQLNVVWSIMKLKNDQVLFMSMVFDYLVSMQDWEYQEFLTLGRKQTHIKTILRRFSNLVDNGLDLNYLIKGKII